MATITKCRSRNGYAMPATMPNRGESPQLAECNCNCGGAPPCSVRLHPEVHAVEGARPGLAQDVACACHWVSVSRGEVRSSHHGCASVNVGVHL
jgi:hypothetical protein